MSESALVVLTPIDSERAEFEKWFIDQRGSSTNSQGDSILTRVNGDYLYSEPNKLWKGWQARAALDHGLEIPFTLDNLLCMKALIAKMEASLGTPSGDSK